MTRTVIGKLDYEGDVARIEGDAVPTRKMLAKVAAFLRAKPMKGQQVVAQIIEEGEYAGWIERIEPLPLDEKLKQHGFGQPTPGPGEAAANAAKDRAEGAANIAENARYAQELAAGREKDATHDDAVDTLRYTEIPPKKIQPGGIEKIVSDTKARNDEAKHDEIQKAVVAHVPQAAVNPVKNYSADEMVLLRNVIAKGCTDPEFKLLMYMASTYGLDPLLKQIWAVKRSDNAPALIFAGRDGMLAIAHRSGHFDGMHSEVVYEGTGKDKKPVSAWCEIWRNDMTHSFKVEVPFSEYNTGFSVWKTNPSAMILKVAESVCLRKAFSVSGLYSPEEINTEQGA